LKTIAKHHCPETFNDDPVFSTGDPQSHQQQSEQWPSTFQTQDSGQPGSDSSLHMTTLLTNASLNTDEYGKDVIISNSVTLEALQVPHKAMVAKKDLPKDVPL
jgi:hypothetical protein